MKTVLSIDGGGIKGIIPARVLQHLEESTGKACYNMFDLVTGTSTGGILALLLSSRYKSSKVVDLYKDNGKKIFEKSLLRMFGLVNEKYNSKELKKILFEYMQDEVFNLLHTNTMVTAYDLYHRQPVFIKSWKPQWQDMKKVDAALATSAAPTYFEPYLFGRDIGLIDGGVCVNNPALSAYVEARMLWPNEDILVVSLGTGQNTRKLKYSKVKDWGLMQWAKPVLDVVFDGMSDVVDYQLEQLLPENNYYRFQVELDNASDEMDNASDENINCLLNEADRLILDNKDRLNELISLLK